MPNAEYAQIAWAGKGFVKKSFVVPFDVTRC
jgi:hypothetical protein